MTQKIIFDRTILDPNKRCDLPISLCYTASGESDICFILIFLIEVYSTFNIV